MPQGTIGPSPIDRDLLRTTSHSLLAFILAKFFIMARFESKILDLLQQLVSKI